MKIKAGDTVEFIALKWNEPQWEFDHPTVVLSPVVMYSPNGTSPESMIEDICIDLCINADSGESVEKLDEDVTKEFEWRRWDVSRMKTVAKNRLNGKSDWCSKGARAAKVTVKFVKEGEETSFEVTNALIQ